jgi:hypothetical protein
VTVAPVVASIGRRMFVSPAERLLRRTMDKDERVQVKLLQGSAVLVCWVDKEVKVGNMLTLKGADAPEGWWSVYSVSEPKKASKINSNRDYKVGGL